MSCKLALPSLFILLISRNETSAVHLCITGLSALFGKSLKQWLKSCPTCISRSHIPGKNFPRMFSAIRTSSTKSIRRSVRAQYNYVLISRTVLIVFNVLLSHICLGKRFGNGNSGFCAEHSVDHIVPAKGEWLGNYANIFCWMSLVLFRQKKRITTEDWNTRKWSEKTVLQKNWKRFHKFSLILLEF